MGKFPSRLYHNTPSWVPDGALFHIRLRVGESQQLPLTEAKLGVELLTAVQRYVRLQHCWCELFLLMPDHAHAILGFPSDPGMTETLRNWKRGTGRFQSVEWQEDYFDHRLRNEHEVQLKWGYIRQNPVVEKLCAQENDWPWWWSAMVENSLLPITFRGGAR